MSTKTIQSENEAKPPPPWWPVFIAIERERFAQIAQWGEQRGYKDGTGHEFFLRMAGEYKAQNDARQEAGKPGVWSKVLLEEVFEALSETDELMLEDELIQTAAVCVAWIEDLRQRRGAKA